MAYGFLIFDADADAGPVRPGAPRDAAAGCDAGVPDTPTCVLPGTRIATIRGPVPVEDLRPGDRVLTLDMGYRPLVWTGRSSRPAVGGMAPVRIAQGTLGNLRDLWVSPLQRMLLRGARATGHAAAGAAFVPAIRLVDGAAIRQVEGGTADYIHVMCDRPQVIFAEGVPVQSFFPHVQGWKVPPRAAPTDPFAPLPGLPSFPGTDLDCPAVGRPGAGGAAQGDGAQRAASPARG